MEIDRKAIMPLALVKPETELRAQGEELEVGKYQAVVIHRLLGYSKQSSFKGSVFSSCLNKKGDFKVVLLYRCLPFHRTLAFVMMWPAPFFF